LSATASLSESQIAAILGGNASALLGV